MYNSRHLGIVAACLMAAAPLAEAGPQDDALVEKVKQLATQGQDAQTTALVNQYVDQHHDLITGILKTYMNYLSQSQTMPGNGTTAPDDSQTALPGTQVITSDAAKTDGPVLQTTNTQPATTAQPATGLQPTTALQPATGLQAADVLRTGHLAGYPSLPDIAPSSSIKQPTAEQLEYAAKVQKEDQARKEYLMTHPWGYTY